MTTEKRYLLFVGTDYYPEGGWDDFVAAFPDQAAADAEGIRMTTEPNNRGTWWHVVDLSTLKIVSLGTWGKAKYYQGD
jgi:hypothetical protein